MKFAKRLGETLKLQQNKDDADTMRLKEARKEATSIKGAMYALSKNPENLTERQKEKLELITAINDKLCRGYARKEQLRLIMHMNDESEARLALKNWLWWASHSRISAFIDLGKKIRRHFENILNTIRLGMSNARIEATNNKIKLIIRKAYGFRNIQNMLDMIMLICSNLHIPLPNRPKEQPETA